MKPVVVPLFSVLLAALALPIAAQERKPYDPQATMTAVAALLEQGHISRAPLDRTISERAFEQLLRGLDPLGLYFLQADVQELGKERDQLGRYLGKGDDGFARRLQERYQKRVTAATELGLRWLGKPLDFTLDETLSFDVAPKDYASNEAELDDRWRRRVKYDLLVLEGDGIKDAAAMERLKKRYQLAAERVVLRTPEQIDSSFIEAVAGSYDPHTSYMPPREAEDFAIHMRLNYEGIGAVLRDEDGRTLIGELLPGGAAIASGQLHAGDVIHAVGQGEEGPIESVVGLEIQEVVDKIRGPRGTYVRLQVTTAATPPRIVVLQRKQTELTSQTASGKVIEQDGARIGWVELPIFYADPRGHSATRDVEKLLQDFTEKRVDCVVLDLRFNGGGLLTEAVSLTGLFLDTGNVVQVQGSDGRIKRLDDEVAGAAWTGPLVVLIDRASASASEIVAGAIVDQDRGIVVGDSATHGKGTVQNVIDLARLPARRGPRPGGSLKLTIQQFFRPGGDSTQMRGVRSDIKLPSATEDLVPGEDQLPYALPFSRVEPAVSVAQTRRDPAVIAVLARASAERCSKDERFARVVADNQRRSDWIKRKVVPLQRSAFAAFRADRQGAPLPGAGAAPDPWYVEEVCRIAKEYAAASKSRDGDGAGGKR